MKKSELNIEKMLKEHQQNFTNDYRRRQLLWLEEASKKEPEDKDLLLYTSYENFLTRICK